MAAGVCPFRVVFDRAVTPVSTGQGACHQSRSCRRELHQRHAEQFDDHILRSRRDAECGLPPGGDSSKVRRGAIGGHAEEMTPEIADAMEMRWKQEMHDTLGFRSYSEMAWALETE